MTNPMCTYEDLKPDSTIHEEANMDQWTHTDHAIGRTNAKGKYYVNAEGTLTVHLGTEAKWYIVDIDLPVDVIAKMLVGRLGK